MVRLLLLSFSVLLKLQLIGQELPEKLTRNANEIIINDLTQFKILSIDHSELTRKYLTKIQNKYAENGNSVELYYNDFRSIENAEVTVYDRNFSKVNHYKLKDFQDWSTKGNSIADDSRIKYLKIMESQYPYFVEVDYTIRFEGSMHYPRWIPQSDEKISVISSQLMIESFLPDSFRYYANINPADSIIEPNHHQYVWRIDSIPSFLYQNFSYDIAAYSPIVQVAPNKFQMDGIIGDMSSWQSFGDWIYTLGKDRNTLTAEQTREIQHIVKDLDELNKIKAIYKYLQDNTRYVSIQLGIGGWQPFDSKFVHENKYGDCKALSFYTQSLLEAVGIPSYYTIIRAGSSQQEVVSDFPNAHFNHAILTVPLEKDTIWLECTSQTNPFGYMGSFTSDRDALMVKEGNSSIIHTRIYTVNDNIQRTFVNQKIHKDGSSYCEVYRRYQGMEIENDGFRRIVDKSNKKQNEWFMDNFKWGDLTLDSLTISEISNEAVPEGSMQVQLQLSKAGTSMGKRLFYQPFTFTNIEYIRLSDKERIVPLEIRYAYTQMDTIEVKFDDVYYIEKPINDIILDSKYGSYSRSVKQEENSFIITRKFQLNKGKYDVLEYPSFRNFIEEVQKNDRERLVMINKT